MDGIQRVFGNTAVQQTGKARGRANEEPAGIHTDQLSISRAAYGRAEVKTAPVAEETRSRLAQVYNVRHMSRNEYTKLLAELRDGGVLTEQEYSAAYGGAMPPGEHGAPWPMGKQTGDFLQLVHEREQQCRACAAECVEQRHCEMLALVYAKLNGVFQQIHSTAAETTSTSQAPTDGTAAAGGRYSAEFYRLYEQLKQDEDYMTMAAQEHESGGLWVPYNKLIFREYLRSEPELLEAFAKYRWTEDAKYRAWLEESNKTRPSDMQCEILPMPPDYRGYEAQYKYTLNHGSQHDQDVLYSDFDAFLRMEVLKCRRLTEEERLVFPSAASSERARWQTFDERMQSVENAIQDGFQSSGLTLDIEKEYQFYLDTSTFTFSVKGGSEEENRLIERVINTNPRESYRFNPLKTAVFALYSHRPADGTLTPWQAEHSDPLEIAQYGISQISGSYARKMKQFLAAWQRSDLDQDLQSRFGFGLADFSWKDGGWVGRTDEITRMIKTMNQDGDWDKRFGDFYRRLMQRYTGTPVFSEPVFTFRNGEFQVTYEEWTPR